MATVQPLAAAVEDSLVQAIATVIPDARSIDPQVRRSDRADFQVNGIMGLAKARRMNPRELAERVAEALKADTLLADCQVAGPGFLNLDVQAAAITRRLTARAADDRLGIATAAEPGVTVIDYSQPNIAKEMHVGHLRSTIIGDALVRILEFGGETVVRRNHLGDWGTQFGMLIQFLTESPQEIETGGTQDGPSLSRLNRLYKLSRARFDTDPEFADRARDRVVRLQAGDPDTIDAWRQIVEESKTYFEAIYQRLDVLLTDADAVGESHYNPQLAAISAELEASGVAVRSNGALCVFFDEVKGPDGNPVPLIIQKSDGGFGYAATDLAAIRDRVERLHATRLLYVVDSRQALHFQMVFETARRAGWLPAGVQAEHLRFGTILGPDGKPFKTRSGETVRLMALLDEAVERAEQIVAEKNPELDAGQLRTRAGQIGVGAVKYADLSTSRTRDYVFDVERMVSLNGDTGTYLQYAYARIQSILAKAPPGTVPTGHPELDLHPAERSLGLLLDEFGKALSGVAESFEPHRLCTYLHQLASAYATFYEHCPVLKAPGRQVMENRLLLCRLTGQTLRMGMSLLGIATPDRL